MHRVFLVLCKVLHCIDLYCNALRCSGLLHCSAFIVGWVKDPATSDCKYFLSVCSMVTVECKIPSSYKWYHESSNLSLDLGERGPAADLGTDCLALFKNKRKTLNPKKYLSTLLADLILSFMPLGPWNIATHADKIQKISWNSKVFRKYRRPILSEAL